MSKTKNPDREVPNYKFNTCPNLAGARLIALLAVLEVTLRSYIHF